MEQEQNNKLSSIKGNDDSDSKAVSIRQQSGVSIHLNKPSLVPKLIRIENELIDVTNELGLSPKLIGIEINIAYAITGTLVNDVPIEEVRLQAVNLVTKAYSTYNFKITEDDIFVMAQDLAIDIKVKHWMLTMWEIWLAFDMGAKDELGESDFLGVKWFNKWLNRFKSLPARASAYRKQREYMQALNAPPEPTEEDRYESMKQSCLKYFEDYKNKVTTVIIDIGNVHYNFLKRHNIIDFNEERRNQFKKEAREKLIEDKRREKLLDTDGFKRNDINKAISELHSDDNGIVIGMAKRVALDTFFKELIDMGSELKDYFEEK